MRVTLIGHACVLIEVGSTRILTDPWLVGPCQLNAWWQVPPVAHAIDELPPIDYMMLSHVHDDHFHLPTLARLPKTATVLIPYSLDPWMRDTLRALGFARVVELEHGRTYRLPQQLLVENVQCGRIDSAFWVKWKETSLLNLNDCPLSIPWLRRWRMRHGSPDLALSAFSYASAYPVCYETAGVDAKRAATESMQRVLDQFAGVMTTLAPRYAVPFATQYGFLIPEQAWMNRAIPTPLQALAALQARGAACEGVLLNPGDQLVVGEGVQRRGPGFDWERRDALVDALVQARANEVQQALRSEGQPPETFAEQARGYFTRLLQQNPLMRRRIGVPIGFVLTDRQERWVIDCTHPADPFTRQNGHAQPIEIHLGSGVLHAAVSGSIHWETLYLSNRFRVKLASAGLLGREWEFWRMLFNFPYGVLRDRLRLLTPRGIRIVRRRYPELAGRLMERLAQPSQREPARET